MINISLIEIRKVDNKGRIILPQKNLSKVFMTDFEGVIILGKTEKEIIDVINTLKNKNRQLQIETLHKWEEMLDDAEILNHSIDKIDKSVLKSQKQSHQFTEVVEND